MSGSMEVKYTACPLDCPDACRVGAYVRDGRVVRLAGDPDHPITRGFLCNKMHHYLDRVYGEHRIRQPLLRQGPKGKGLFQPIGWDEAIAHIAERFKEIISSCGAESILPYSYSGTMGLLNNGAMDRRFFHRLGASRLGRTICSSAGLAGYRYTTGATYGADPEGIPQAKLIIGWGTNTLATNVHFVPLLEEARSNDAIYVHINTQWSKLADRADLFLQPLPGTDAALALAMMHVIIAERLYDEDFVVNHADGFEQLRGRVEGYPPESVARITGIAPDRIRRAAQLYASTKPAFIRAGGGIQRHTNGAMAMRAVACLPALVGMYGVVGGGFLYSNGGVFPLNRAALERDDLIEGDPRTINMVRLGTALTEADPPVYGLYVYNSNPVAAAPNQSRVLQGLAREDLFTVVHEQVLTDTTDYADIVLPATTFLEHADLYQSYFHLYLQWAEPVIAPVGESKSNVEVFQLLARAMGFEDPCFADGPEEMVAQALDGSHPFLEGVAPERLKAEGCVRLNTPTSPFVPFADGLFPTPSGRLQFFSQELAAKGYEPLPGYVPIVESRDANPALHKEFPIALINCSSGNFLNSTMAELPSMVHRERLPVLELHVIDAGRRSIFTGDMVRVWNTRGECYLYASVGERVPRGVALAYRTWWPKHCPGGANVNILTSERISDIGGGATFYTNSVQVEKVFGPHPAVPAAASLRWRSW